MTQNSIATRSALTVVAGLAALGALTACSTDTDAETTPTQRVSQSVAESTATPSDVLASTAWETTGARDQNGQSVALTDESVANYVGWAYFKTDGTFTMYTLADAPKMHGDWTVSADGKTRTIVAKDDAGEVKFTRDSDIVTLDDAEFVYRVYPTEGDRSVYVDIVHTPTDHAEPAA